MDISGDIARLRSIFGDPKGPFYGTNLVAWVGNLIDGYETLKQENSVLKQRLKSRPPLFAEAEK